VSFNPVVLVLIGSLLAAAGQIFLKIGADGAVRLTDYMNARLAIGFALYGLGSIVWVMALARLPLSRVYPFTMLTFVLVYLGSFALLGERITGQVLAGAFLVLAGLVLISRA
jgi:drug/metabolite transporter (DMT)-like permease